MESSPRTTTHIALVSVPAFSHQVSILEFAKRLLHLHADTFHVTCIIPTLSSSPSKHSFFFDSLPHNIHCIFLPSVNFHDLNNNGVSVEVQTQLSASRAMSSVRETLVSLSKTTDISVLVADAMAPEALEFGKELHILSYIYFPCSTMVLSVCFHSQNLDEEVSCEYKDHPGLIHLPGCIPISGRDLPDSMQDRGSLAYKLFLQRCQRYLNGHDGILVNSFTEFEEEATKAISQHGNGGDYPPVYSVGPITQSGPSGSKSRCECLLWLDKQEPNSVLYVSFGSGGTLSQEQIDELALGLELSKQKFLWVNLRAPNDRASATYFSEGGLVDDDPLHFLPKGFLERTKEQGLVMCGWAPQVEVLGHRSIGAFLSHCGWNSVLESVVHGVPMIAWPLFAEQRSNAALVSDGLKVALRPKMKNPSGINGVVVKEEIVKLIKAVMEGLEGEEIRRKVKELKKLANCAMMGDGSSTRTIANLANKWKLLGKSL
ncbi:hydroquinone glucosyltransferase-like [Vigna umbellata]|uniref:hydroquinone glucosyltransferase-like n=1 Tax=Vigna umbellata TaxID=87088 RepID=UPI001F5E6B05|nr:hydroquinone glucosyltransferase-like [Vigna umbellata]